MKKILFLCTANSCRSQMAEAFVRSIFPGRIKAYSAGIKPAAVNPYAIRAMLELGIDISGQSSKDFSVLSHVDFDLVVTLCGDARESCPVFPGHTEIAHIGFPDPALAEGTDEEVMRVFRSVRDRIREEVPAFLKEKFRL